MTARFVNRGHKQTPPEPVDGGTVDVNPYASPRVITTQQPAPQPAVYTSTKYQSVERDTFNEAYSWARGEMRGYPGAHANLETLDSLIKQYMNGLPREAQASKPPQ